MQNIDINVIFGGSFNPPTIAHYEISKAIIDKFKVNDFVFVPTSLNYGKKTLIDSKMRPKPSTRHGVPCQRDTRASSPPRWPPPP